MDTVPHAPDPIVVDAHDPPWKEMVHGTARIYPHTHTHVTQ